MKKTIYILLTIFLCLELSFMLHGLIEIIKINSALVNGVVLENVKFLGIYYCILPVWSQYLLLLVALIGGYFLGQTWWRIVYVEKRHWRMKKK